MEIIILLVLIFVNGLFVMSEIALVSARKSRLEYLAEKGDSNARKALELSNTPEKFLSAAQIGITLIAILTGVYSGERFAIPVPLACADAAISSVMVVAYLKSAEVATRTIIFDCSTLLMFKMNYGGERGFFH